MLDYDAQARGFVCSSCRPASGPILPAGARRFLLDVFRRAPGAIEGALPDDARPLESFHEMLIGRHLERTLRSLRVLRAAQA